MTWTGRSVSAASAWGQEVARGTHLSLGWARPFCHPLHTHSLPKNPDILAPSLDLFASLCLL